MQLVVNAQLARDRSVGDPGNRVLRLLEERLEKRAGFGRQRQTPVLCPPGLLPALGRDEQPLAAAEREAVFDPDCAITQYPAQRQQRRHLDGAYRLADARPHGRRAGWPADGHSGAESRLAGR